MTEDIDTEGGLIICGDDLTEMMESGLRFELLAGSLASGHSDQSWITTSAALGALADSGLPPEIIMHFAAIGLARRASAICRDNNRAVEKRAVAQRRKSPRQVVDVADFVTPKAIELAEKMSAKTIEEREAEAAMDAMRAQRRREAAEEARRVDAERAAGLRAKVGGYFDAYFEVRLAEWTDELLDSSFAYNHQGQTVKWSEATIEHHQCRVAMLISQAGSLASTAALHEQAIGDIRSARVACLAEIVNRNQQRG
jgi:hypothetical protein